MHRAALALGQPALAPGQFGHDPTGFHAASQHMPMVAVRCYALVAVFGSSLKTDHNRLLADVEMAEAANQAHSVKLAGLFLESSDQQHFTVERQQLFFGSI